ncbi:MAG TPA: nucleotide exchange factor GrpE [Pyrinomonadaceae bacterium]|nr:nucleotide exchange factor GrpE [Pyrinomonadaceae bacterium]
MTSDKKKNPWSRIPIRFLDAESSDDSPAASDLFAVEPDNEGYVSNAVRDDETDPANEDAVDPREGNGVDNFADDREPAAAGTAASIAEGGPAVAELVATRAELKRVETEINELKDRLARRQADFENYRKRVEREKTGTYNRVVADIATKLLPVLDNLRRALDAEASVEASESDEFRHFLSGVDLIYKQLDGVFDALGVKPIPAVGEQFDPHVHEAVVTEPTDQYEPDTVIQEIVRGYRIGDKLIRPALVKVAARK